MIIPSILNADNMFLGKSVKELLNNNICTFHIDIMDGHFVPNLSYGPELIKDLKTHFPKAKIEIHLMSNNLKCTLPLFINTNCCDLIEFHLEADTDPHKWISYLHAHHIKAGLALNPNSKLDQIIPFLPHLDQLLIMSVYPGFGGQHFIAESLTKIKNAKTLINKQVNKIPIEVDGGININTIKSVSEAGANKFVVGSYLFKNNTISKQIHTLEEALSN